MQLSPIVDIVIGLLFVYLTLSLLASEIQELIATLLQWRAAHLKQSIAQLLGGGSQSTVSGRAPQRPGDSNRAEQLTERLYDSPTINSLNQEARGLLATGFRKGFRVLCNLIGLSNPIFGQHTSAPSHIPPSSFADALLSSAKIPELIRTVSLRRFEQFTQDLGRQTRQLLQPQLSDSRLTQLLDRFEQRLRDITTDYRSGKFDLKISLTRVLNSVDRLISILQAAHVPEVDRLVILRDDTFEDREGHTILLAALLPSTEEVLDGLRHKRAIYQEVQSVIAELRDANDPTRKGLEEALNLLPEPVQDNLLLLAKRARSRATSVQEDFQEFQKEVEGWYDRARDRASGVYRRNARGVSILLGIVLAVASNADTFNIVSKLSRDTALRQAVNAYADRVVQTGSAPGVPSRPMLPKWSEVSQDMQAALDETTLPIGWDSNKLNEQLRYDNRKPKNQGEVIWVLIRTALGWLVTGLAIAMGAPFWFDLLGKIMRVKNTGKSEAS